MFHVMFPLFLFLQTQLSTTFNIYDKAQFEGRAPADIAFIRTKIKFILQHYSTFSLCTEVKGRFYCLHIPEKL